MIEIYENAIINFTEVQSIEIEGNFIKVTFINGHTTNVKTHKYDYIIEGGRITNARYNEYNKTIENWQKKILKKMFESLDKAQKIKYNIEKEREV